MRIVADQNIPFVIEAFGSLGQVITAPGTAIDAELVSDADLLLVRSVTQVNRELLEGSSVKFVGTATIGRDHIDEEYLKEAEIGFSSAPASNANSVAEWVVTALALVAQEQGLELQGKRLAIVGVGNIGTALYKKAKALGMNIVLNDPPKAAEGNSAFVELEEALKDADYVSFHVPLTYDGEWPTAGMINNSLLSMMKDGAVLINAARGRIMVEEQLLKHAERFDALILDVWPEEPKVSNELLKLTRIATPHIAGYSFDGKCTGTGMIYRAATAFLFQQQIWNEKLVLEEIETEPIEYNPESGLAGVLLTAYDLLGDDKRMREISSLSGKKRLSFFSSLRKEYPRRYEFSHFTVTGCTIEKDLEILESLGFNVEK